LLRSLHAPLLCCAASFLPHLGRYPLLLPSAGTHWFCQLCPRHSPSLSSRTFIKVLYRPLQAFYKSIISASAGAL
jgi:hypothetical protein